LSEDLQRPLAHGPLTPFQLVAIVVCVSLNMLDGFDILAMSFAASGVKADWHLADRQLGSLLSAGLVGMGLGSLTLASCADRWGRRTIVLLSVSLACLGMLASAAAGNYVQLLVLRVITGLGIGGTIASVAVIASEYSPDRWRGTVLAAYATGYPIGATIGGAIAAYTIPHYGWRSAYAVGGVLTLLLLPVAWRKLPESLEFLLTRRPPGALPRINELFVAIGRPPLSALPAVTGSGTSARPAARLAPPLTASTLLVWTVFFCTMAGFYFIVSWTPRLLNAAGLSSVQGITAGVLLNLGGIAGCGLFALSAARAEAHRLLLASLIGSAVLIAAFGMTLGRLEVALWTALLLGVISNAAMAGLYAVGPPLYPTAIRGTGMGWAVGIGRLGAILAPLAAGALLERGWVPSQLYWLFSVPFVVAAVAMLWIVPARTRLPLAVG
jgi:benzoate transport